MLYRYKEWHGELTCDDCGAHAHCTGNGFSDIDVEARALGWAIAKDHKHCYCPKCAKVHRNTGCYGSADVQRWRSW